MREAEGMQRHMPCRRDCGFWLPRLSRRVCVSLLSWSRCRLCGKESPRCHLCGQRPSKRANRKHTIIPPWPSRRAVAMAEQAASLQEKSERMRESQVRQPTDVRAEEVGAAHEYCACCGAIPSIARRGLLQPSLVTLLRGTRRHPSFIDHLASTSRTKTVQVLWQRIYASMA